MRTINLQPDLSTLTALIAVSRQVTDNPLIVAGGYIRDKVLGTEPRDIDMYCYASDFTNLVVNLHLHWTERERWAAITDQKSDEYVHQSVYAQTEFKTKHFGLVNLIAIKEDFDSIWDVTDKFNIGLNQMGYERETGLYISEAAYHDMRNATATILREDWGFEGTEKAVRKLCARYPEIAPVFKDGTTWTRREAEYRHTGQSSFPL